MEEMVKCAHGVVDLILGLSLHWAEPDTVNTMHTKSIVRKLPVGKHPCYVRPRNLKYNPQNHPFLKLSKG